MSQPDKTITLRISCHIWISFQSCRNIQTLSAFNGAIIMMLQMDQQRKKSVSTRLQAYCSYQYRQRTTTWCNTTSCNATWYNNICPLLCARPFLHSMCVVSNINIDSALLTWYFMCSYPTHLYFAKPLTTPWVGQSMATIHRMAHPLRTIASGTLLLFHSETVTSTKI